MKANMLLKKAMGGGKYSRKNLNNKNPKITLFFSIAFILTICVPILFKIGDYNPDIGTIQENRTLAKAPKFKTLKLKQITEGWDQYFKDRLPFRRAFLSAYIFTYEKILESYVSEYVTGKNGELFMNHASPIVSASLGIIPYDKPSMENLTLSVAGKYAYYYSKKIPYYIVVVPDKSTLYPEMLPFYSKWIKHDGWYKYEIESLGQAKIPYINLYKPLKALNNKKRMYDKIYDNCHWNGDALELAYNQIAKIISKDNIIFTPVKTPEFYELQDKIVKFGVYGQDKTKFIKIKDKSDIKCGLLDFKYTDEITGQYRTICTNSKKANGTLWIFSDSYFAGTHGIDLSSTHGSDGNVMPFIHNVHTYIHTHYAMSKPYTDVIRERLIKYYPDAVIEEFVERMRGFPHSLNDPLLRILGDIWLKTDGLSFYGNSALGSSIKLSNIDNFQFQIKNSEHYSILKTTSDSPSILSKKPFVADQNGRIVLSASYTSPANTFAQLFYTNQQTNFTEAKSIKQEIRKGLNIIHMSFHVTPFEKVWLEFRPGATPGEYVFKDIPEVENLKTRMSKNGL